MSKYDPYDHLKVSLNSDGSLTRYIKLPTSAALSEDNAKATGQSVISKDVTLNAAKNTWMRIHRPVNLPSARLPIILYFHAGSWIQFSVANTLVHENNNRLAAHIPAVVVAVEFRLAPEHRLPAQYEDAMDAVSWLRDQATDRAGGDPWIRDLGDMERVYLYGVDCGANIALNAAMRLSEMRPQPLKIAGTIMNQPLIGGKKRTKSELKLATDPYFPLPVLDLFWELALPIGTDRDHRFCNPFVDGPMKERVKNLGRCLVIGFGGDPLIDRQQESVQVLVEQGVQVEARFDDVGFHGIDMIDARRSTAILSFIKDFIV